MAKILISAVVGMFAGLVGGVVLEPLRSWMGRRLAAKRARQAIYKELGNLYQLFCLANSRTDEAFCHHALKYNPPDTFDFYYQQHREACFLIPDWRGLEGFYQVYKVARQVALDKGRDPKNHPTLNVATARGVAREFTYRFEIGDLSKETILTHAKERPANIALPHG